MERLVIFDLDGTLFNTVETNFRSYQKALAELGFSLDYEHFRNYCNGRHYSEFLPEIIGDDEEILQTAHERKKQLYDEFIGYAVPNENLINMAASLKGKVHTAIVTTASHDNTVRLLHRFSCKEYFEKIFTREDFTKNKPDPEGFLLAMDYFGVKEDKALIFEDSDVGIEAAKRSGADYCIVTGYR